MGPALLLALALTVPGGERAPRPPSSFPGADADPALTAKIDQALELRVREKRDEALALLEQVRGEALAKGHAAIATNALNRTGDVLRDQGKSRKARAAYEQAYAEAEKRGDPWAMGRAAHDLALLGDFMRPDAESLGWYEKALAARREAKDFAGMRVTANNLATVHDDAGRRDEALPFFEAGIEAAEAAGDHGNAMKLHARLGSLLLELGDERSDPELAKQGRAHLAQALGACERGGGDPLTLCAWAGRDRAKRCAANVPTEGPLGQALLHQREAKKSREQLERTFNGFANPAVLLRAGRELCLAARALREAGAGYEERAALLEQEARPLVLDGLANLDATESLAALCAREEAAEACDACGFGRRE